MGLTAELEIDVRRSDGERKPGYQSEAGKIYIFFFLKDCSIRWRLAARTVRTAFREDGELLPGGGRKKKNFSFIKKKNNLILVIQVKELFTEATRVASLCHVSATLIAKD